MTAPYYANNITAQDLRIFLDSWPQFVAEAEEVQLMLIEDKDKFLADDASKFSWCHLYELPINQHLAIIRSGLAHDGKIQDCYNQIGASQNQIAILPDVLGQVKKHFDEMDALSKKDAEEMRPFLAGFLGVHLSAFHSLRSVLFFGCFLNELIERVRGGGDDGDKALFNVIRLDPTVVGCKPVVERISKAFLIRDSFFFKKLKAALNGNIGKREQANFQKMRLIFEVLYEAGAMSLTDNQLHQLFVEELKLYSGNEIGGGNAKALRKFADTYMKKNATT